MDNYLKHLLHKLPATKEFSRNEFCSQIRIGLQKENDDVKNLDNLGEVYKASGEIVDYLKKTHKIDVEYMINEIVITYQ